jgi:hypothetical protein
VLLRGAWLLAPCRLKPSMHPQVLFRYLGTKTATQPGWPFALQERLDKGVTTNGQRGNRTPDTRIFRASAADDDMNNLATSPVEGGQLVLQPYQDGRAGGHEGVTGRPRPPARGLGADSTGGSERAARPRTWPPAQSADEPPAPPSARVLAAATITPRELESALSRIILPLGDPPGGAARASRRWTSSQDGVPLVGRRAYP